MNSLWRHSSTTKGQACKSVSSQSIGFSHIVKHSEFTFLYLGFRARHSGGMFMYLRFGPPQIEFRNAHAGLRVGVNIYSLKLIIPN